MGVAEEDVSDVMAPEQACELRRVVEEGRPHAGIEILLREQGVQRLDSILLAGTFGNHLDPDDILRIGMVPPIRVRALHSIGNAAGDGARMALLNRRQRQRAHRLARRIRVLELATRPDFQALFIACTLLAADPLVDADIPA